MKVYLIVAPVIHSHISSGSVNFGTGSQLELVPDSQP